MKTRSGRVSKPNRRFIESGDDEQDTPDYEDYGRFTNRHEIQMPDSLNYESEKDEDKEEGDNLNCDKELESINDVQEVKATFGAADLTEMHHSNEEMLPDLHQTNQFGETANVERINQFNEIIPIDETSSVSNTF